HTSKKRDLSSDVCSSDLTVPDPSISTLPSNSADSFPSADPSVSVLLSSAFVPHAVITTARATMIKNMKYLLNVINNFPLSRFYIGERLPLSQLHYSKRMLRQYEFSVKVL